MSKPAMVIIGAVASLVMATATDASDYSHVCRTADGTYELDDGLLVATSDAARKPIDYETIRETVLSEIHGYCVAGGQKYEFTNKTYVIRIRFRDSGHPIEANALCELAADGLPAAHKCEREVVTSKVEIGKPAAGSAKGSGSLWTHNGSTLRLEVAGVERRFVYTAPRPGMQNAGAKSGDVVFKGRRDGTTYTGTAYIITKACGRVAYTVSGNIADNERRVVLEGQVPVLGQGCKIRSYRHDRLQFDLVER